MLIQIPLFNAIVTVGDFLLAVRSGDATTPSVCVVRDVENNGLRVTWWLTWEELVSQGNIEVSPPLHVDLYGNLLKCRMMEVVEDCSTVSLINVCDVRDLAFVFHANTLEEEFINCAGMTRVYYTRYRLCMNGSLAVIDNRFHLPFSKVCVESYPSRIWYFILEVKSNVEKLLNDSKQFQPCKKMVLMACSLECWQYLLFTMSNCGAIYFTFQRNHTDKNFHCDLSLTSCRTKKLLHLLRIDSQRSLNCARNLFGLTFGIGIRNRAPRKGEQAVTMHNGDVVNMVDVTGTLPINRTQEFISSQGVDLIYNEAIRSLKIRVRYSRFLAENHSVTATLNLNNLQLPPRREQHNLVVPSIVEPGTFFMREGTIVEVIRVVGSIVTVREDETYNEFILSLNEAAQLITNYIE